MKDKLIIVGTGDYAEVAHFLLLHEGRYDLLAFSEERAFMKANDFKGMPIFAFEDLPSLFGIDDVHLLVAIGPNRVNTVRERLYCEAKAKGFNFIRYVSPQALVWDENAIGENSFIFPQCVIEPFATVGVNSVLWSGCLLSHHALVADHCFLAPGVCVSGRTVIRNNCFIGINATIRDNIVVEERCIVGGGAVIKRNTEPDGVYSATGTPLYNYHSLQTRV
jgi:sugar O-acyltransferase (sialic acid O-acetyltransferase NeuD family)